MTTSSRKPSRKTAIPASYIADIASAEEIARADEAAFNGMRRSCEPKGRYVNIELAWNEAQFEDAEFNNARRDAAAEREIAAGEYINDKCVRVGAELSYEPNIEIAMMSAWEEENGVNRDFYYRNWFMARYCEPATYQKSIASCREWAAVENAAFDEQRDQERRQQEIAAGYIIDPSFAQQVANSEYARRWEAGYVEHASIAYETAIIENAERDAASDPLDLRADEPDTYIENVNSAFARAFDENNRRHEATYVRHLITAEAMAYSENEIRDAGLVDSIAYLDDPDDLSWQWAGVEAYERRPASVGSIELDRAARAASEPMMTGAPYEIIDQSDIDYLTHSDPIERAMMSGPYGEAPDDDERDPQSAAHAVAHEAFVRHEWEMGNYSVEDVCHMGYWVDDDRNFRSDAPTGSCALQHPDEQNFIPAIGIAQSMAIFDAEVLSGRIRAR